MAGPEQPKPQLSRIYVVDTTELVSFMLNPNGLSGKIIRSLELELHTPYFALLEIQQHREEWLRKRPRLSLSDFLYILQFYVQIHYIDRSSKEFKAAQEVMNNIDPFDTEFLALALKLNTPIWSEDSDFGKQEQVHWFTTYDILRRSYEIPTLWEAVKDDWYRLVERRRSAPDS